MSKKKTSSSSIGSSGIEDVFYFFINIFISILLFFAILNSVVSCIKSPFKSYEILTKWEKTTGVIDSHYYDNENLFMDIYNIYSFIFQTTSAFSNGYFIKEQNIFSYERVKYHIYKEEIIGTSTNSYLFNFDINKNVDIYYNTLKPEEIIINTPYRLYIEPILDYIYLYLLLKIVIFFFKSKKKNKINVNDSLESKIKKKPNSKE